MFEAQVAESFVDADGGAEEPSRSRARLHAVSPAVAAEEAYTPSHYSSGSKKSWLPFVVAAHVILLWAAVHFDVTHHHHRKQRLEVKLVPLDVAPPPKAPPPDKPVEVKVQTPIVSPPPIVQMPTLAPPPVQSAPVPQPPAPVAVSVPTAPVAPAPVVPPDGFAANLGNVGPSYPIESRRNHEEGVVRLRVVISPQGSVQEISIAKSSGYDALDDAALRAVRKWKFRPGTQAGVAVEATGFVPVTFRLPR